MRKISIVFCLLLLSSYAKAKPILNSPLIDVGSVTDPIYADSKDKNIFWYQIKEVRLCGQGSDSPLAAIRAFKLDNEARVYATFDLCPFREGKVLNAYLGELLKKNPNAQLKPLSPLFSNVKKLSLPFAKELNFISSCIIPDVRVAKISCSVFSQGQKSSERLYRMLNTNGLLAANYVDYSVAGVEEVEPGQFRESIFSAAAIYYVTGFSNYPKLFDTEWKPEPLSE